MSELLYRILTLVCPKLFFCKQLSLVGNNIRPKNYENGLSVVLEFNVKNSTILTFKVIFYVKNRPNPSQFFFIGEYKKGDQLLFLSSFDNFDF